MDIHLYTTCWNDADMLPFFFKHYDPIISKYVIFDDSSNDETLHILRSHPKVELQPFVRSDPSSFTLSELSLSNECWKCSRGHADWVLVIDIDEHLFHPDLLALLRRYRNDGITIIPALGYQMVSEEFPPSDALLCDICAQGGPWNQYSKLAFFDPGSIFETNYDHGRHRAQPTGRAVAPARDELLLLHYKFLGFERTYSRLLRQRSGLRSKDIDNGWGYHYSWSEEEFRDAWSGFAERLIDVRTDAAVTSYPRPRWWDPFRPSALADAIAQKDAHARALGDAIAQKDAHARALEDAIAQKDAHARALEDAIAQKDAHARALEDAITQKNSEIGEFQNALAEARHQNVDLVRHGQKLEQVLREIGEDNNALIETIRRNSEVQLQQYAVLKRNDYDGRLPRELIALRRLVSSQRKELRCLAKYYRLIAGSPLFDSKWYLATNPDVAGKTENPILHYLLYGAQEDRMPGPLFDSYRY